MVFTTNALGFKHLKTVSAASDTDAAKAMQETAVFNALMRMKNGPTVVVKPAKIALQEVLDGRPGWASMLAPQIEEIMCGNVDDCVPPLLSMQLTSRAGPTSAHH